jgi:hypothetical protein
MSDINEAFGFKVKQRVRTLVPCLGADHEDFEHAIPAGRIAEIDAIEIRQMPAGATFTVWIPVDQDKFYDRGIVNVFDQEDGPVDQFFERIDAE